MTKDFWNDRYGQTAFAYGTEPNLFLATQLSKLKPGRILFPAEGEGRNAVFAAKTGWQVAAFDQSESGKQKAERLAQENGVSIDYRAGEFQSIAYPSEEFDVIALIYAHFPADVKSQYHRQLSKYLKKGGIVIFEAFGKQHLPYVTQNPKVGGPRDIDMLFSTAELQADFSDYEIRELAETEIMLEEGIFHNGLGSVVRFVGRKK
ncbi:MAG: class I SAM-dependent methyltransferase [Cytophagales bacterium]|nr:class I SAM-dependent methyltransferase [Cytophagales bacterium]